MTKVCVAICNYNHERYLEESVKSVICQDYENLDIAVIDDCSEDSERVKEIVNSLGDKRVRLLLTEKNTGKWNALNRAFATTDAMICTSHDADDISLPWRISSQLSIMKETNTLHNLCGFVHCWNEDDVIAGYKIQKPNSFRVLDKDEVTKLVSFGYQTQGINHYFTGKFETAGVSSMFFKQLWDMGVRFNPPSCGIRILNSEDSDFNCRMTLAFRSTSILAETPYLYRRNTSTNKELK